MLTSALRFPFAVGLKVTLIVQLAPAATLVPQVLVCEKSFGLVRVMLMPVPVIVRVDPPLLVRVTVIAADVVPPISVPKFKLVGDRVTVGGAFPACPVKIETLLDPWFTTAKSSLPSLLK